MQRVISFIIAKDENGQNILMNVDVDKNYKINKLNIGGYVFSDEEVKNMADKIQINKELFETMKDNEPLDITYDFTNISKDELIKSIIAEIKGA